MKSIILCEGPDDIWFIAYYLNKTDGWDRIQGTTIQRYWKNYQVNPLDHHQQVEYLKRADDYVCIWCVGGKDRLAECLNICINKFVKEFPKDPLNAIIPVRDRDKDEIADVLSGFAAALPGNIVLKNKERTVFHVYCDGEDTVTSVIPLIIPFDREGAIETLLMKAVQESSEDGAVVVRSAEQYIDELVGQEGVRTHFLPHERLLVKAKYCAVVSVTNPNHSTGRFQDMVMSCPWETSPSVKKHFDVIRNAVTSKQ